MNHAAKFRRCAASVSLFFLASALWAFQGGRISGIIKDPGGDAIPDAKLAPVERAWKAVKGSRDSLDSFPALAVGSCHPTIEASGPAPQKRTGVAVDSDAAVAVDVVLALLSQTESIIVSESAANVPVPETLGHLGDASRIFQGPGIDAFDVPISNNAALRESKSFDERAEAFHLSSTTRNSTGPASVDGEVKSRRGRSRRAAAVIIRSEAGFLMYIRQMAATFLLC